MTTTPKALTHAAPPELLARVGAAAIHIRRAEQALAEVEARGTGIEAGRSARRTLSEARRAFDALVAEAEAQS